MNDINANHIHKHKENYEYSWPENKFVCLLSCECGERRYKLEQYYSSVKTWNQNIGFGKPETILFERVKNSLR